MIFDPGIASNKSPAEFVKTNYLTKEALDSLKEISIEQDCKFTEIGMKKLEWIDAEKEDPCNGELCVIELSNGEFGIAEQRAGCWPEYVEVGTGKELQVVRWAFYDDEWFTELMRKQAKQ